MDKRDTRTIGRRGKVLVASGLIAATLAVAAAPASSATEPASVEGPAPASVLDVGDGRTLGVGSESGARELERSMLGSRRNAGEPADPSGGFIYDNARYTPLDGAPGAPVTAHVGLNNHGQIVGSYPVDGSTLLRGFVRSERGDYQGLDAALGAPDRLTTPFKINERGAIAGTFAVGSAADPDSVEFHGFVRSPGGEITTVDVPGAAMTGANGINNHGAVVGTYVDAGGRSHGFLLERGEVTPIDPPKAGDLDLAGAQVQAQDINDRGQIVGFYQDAQGTFHGFLHHAGEFTDLDPPEAAADDRNGFAESAAFGVNNRGQVVGQYVDAEGVLHGYLWERGRGFETIDPPGGAAKSCGEIPGVGRVCGTVAADINDRGQILLPAPGSLFKGDGAG
jgi:probable HAF family extracellular repeat protein